MKWRAPSMAADVEWRHAGPGHSSTFRCGQCDQPRLPTGRKLLPVRGLRVYVCKACVQQREARAVAVQP